MPVRLPSPFRLSLLALALTAAMHTTAVSGKDTSLPDNASQSVNAGQPDAASDAAGSQSATSSSTADPTAAGNGTATSGASSDLQSSQGQGRFVLGEELPKKRSAGDGTTGPAGTGNPRNGQGQNPDKGGDQTASGHGAGSSAQGSAYPEMDWEKLIPPNWEPLKDFKSLNFSGMSDNDPRAIAALRKLQKAWKNAPLNPAIQQEKITISGFIVPLDSSDSTTIEEFLLVPYFGACIHVPPPPSNQVIHVVPEKPLKGFQIMDPVTVQGVLAPSHIDTPLGSAGYQMSGKSVTPYEAEDMQEAKPAHP